MQLWCIVHSYDKYNKHTILQLFMNLPCKMEYIYYIQISLIKINLPHSFGWNIIFAETHICKCIINSLSKFKMCQSFCRFLCSRY